jgi:hypothetical protein
MTVNFRNLQVKSMQEIFKDNFEYSNKRLILFLSLIGILMWSYPIWFTPGKAAAYDWGQQMMRFEALRRTVVQYHQWPGTNPWSLGGIPLLGNPSVFIVSIRGLMALMFGTYWGLRLAIVIYLYICFWGSWKLSGLWWRNHFIRLIFSFYVTANSAMIYHLTVGHLLFLNFYFFPLLLFYLLTNEKDKWSGLKAGLIMAIAVNDSPAYMPQYAALILGFIYICLWLKGNKQDRKALFQWVLLFVPVCLALCFYRIVTILEFAHDYSRVNDLKWHYSFMTLFTAYLVPYMKLSYISRVMAGGSWEICCYLGITTTVLWIRSISRGIRWWHIMAILVIWAAMGNDHYFHLMYWIKKLPTFSSHLAFVRIRVFSIIFFAIGALFELDHLRQKFSSRKRLQKRFLQISLLLVGEVVLVSHVVMRYSHPEPLVNPQYTPNSTFQSVRKIDHSYIYKSWTSYEAMRMNLGWLDGSGYSNLPPETICIDRDDPNYISEFHQGDISVEPVYWSPNRILFENLDPEVALTINLNPGNPWHCNGVKVFPDLRIVELNKKFIVSPDASGTVDLSYLYPGQKIGIKGTGVLLVLAMLPVCYVYRKKGRGVSEEISTDR